MKRTIFIHVPKTAGSSVYKIFEQLYPPELSQTGLYVNHVDQIQSDSSFIAGHFGVADIQSFLSLHNDTLVISFVRDPVERVVSLYSYWREQAPLLKNPQENPSYYGVKRALECDSIEDFIDTKDPEILKDISNAHCRYLSSGVNEVTRFIPQWLLYRQTLSSIRANNIQVFTTDDIAGAMSYIAKELGAGDIQTDIRTNITKVKKPLLDSGRRKIEAINKADVALYKHIYAQTNPSEQ